MSSAWGVEMGFALRRVHGSRWALCLLALLVWLAWGGSGVGRIQRGQASQRVCRASGARSGPCTLWLDHRSGCPARTVPALKWPWP